MIEKMSLSKQSFLEEPSRIDVIKKHRGSVARCPAPEQMFASNCVNECDYDAARNEVKDLKEIYLNEIMGRGNRKSAHTYQGRFIELTIIGEPWIECVAFTLEDFSNAGTTPGYNYLVEDKNGVAINMQVWGGNHVPEKEIISERFAIGTKILVVDPITRFDSFVKAKTIFWFVIYGWTSGNVIPAGKKIDMCRYCGKENATKKCIHCKHQYCSRDCQVSDWKVLNHKLVCNAKSPVSTSGSGENKEKARGADGVEIHLPGFSRSGMAISTEEEPSVKSVGAKAKSSKGKMGQRENGNESPNGRNASSTSNGNEETAKPLFLNKNRITCVANIRKNLNISSQVLNGDVDPASSSRSNSNSIGKMKNSSGGILEPIYLKDMKFGNFYGNNFIELTVIEEPLPGFGDGILFVVEDKNKDVSNLVANGFPLAPDGRFGFGTKLLVVNPHYKKGISDGLPLIRVESLKKIMHLGKKVDMCRYCGKENAEEKCENCGKMYCEDRCKTLDELYFHHHLVCQEP